MNNINQNLNISNENYNFNNTNNQNLNNNNNFNPYFNRMDMEIYEDLYPTEIGEKINIIFLIGNIRKKVKILSELKMQELYGVAREIYNNISKSDEYYEIHLFHNQNELDIEEYSIKDISNCDFINIEFDTYYKSILEKHKNSKRIALEVCIILFFKIFHLEDQLYFLMI